MKTKMNSDKTMHCNDGGSLRWDTAAITVTKLVTPRAHVNTY